MADMTLSEARDQVRQYINRWVRPLEKIEAVLEAAQTAHESTVTLTREIDTLTAHLARLRAEQPDVEAASRRAQEEISALAQQVQAARAASEAAQTEARVKEQQAQDATHTVLQRIDEEARAHRLSVNAAHRTLVTQYEREIADLTEKKKGLDAAIAALKAKF